MVSISSASKPKRLWMEYPPRYKMKIFCHRCGNSLTPESLFCNRCGAKTPNQEETGQGRAGRLMPSPPRPARRSPVIPSPDEEPYEEYGEGYQREEDYQEDYPERGDNVYGKGRAN